MNHHDDTRIQPPPPPYYPNYGGRPPGPPDGPRVKLVAVYLIALAAFVGGALLERLGWLPGASSPNRLLPTFNEAWRVVEKHYVDREAVQPERMREAATQGAIEGLVNSLGDVGHTTYLTAEEVKQLTNSLEGKLEGIGARITLQAGQPTIVSTMPDSPARKAGIQPGDVILGVNGKTVSGMSLERLVTMVRGPAGSKVTLKLARRGRSTPLDVTLARARVSVPPVTAHLLPGTPIAHVAIQEFGKDADARLRLAIKDMRAQGAKGLIVDVRGNPGGMKDQAVAVTSEFLKDGTVFQERDAAGRVTDVAVKPGGIATDIPMVVLIDGGSASSSEIFAGAIQDYRRGKLVGTKTFGTGTVLRPFELSDGSAILLAVTEWLTPRGRQIWHKGIMPDVTVRLPQGARVLLPEAEAGLDAEALHKSSDKQLLKALEVLQEQMGAKKSEPAAAQK